jgi:hypothetical protein
MSGFDGNGNFLISGAGLPFVSGTTISSSVVNTLNNAFATGLTTAICKDGQSTCTAVVPFALGLSANALVDLSAGTAGQIKFPATQNPSSNPNTLDDYEEGSWTPADGSGASLTFTSVNATYTKIGNLVVARATLTYPVTLNGSDSIVAGLPFSADNAAGNEQCFVSFVGNSNFNLQMVVLKNTSTLAIYKAPTGAAVAVRAKNSDVSSTQINFTAIYTST